MISSLPSPGSFLDWALGQGLHHQARSKGMKGGRRPRLGDSSELGGNWASSPEREVAYQTLAGMLGKWPT